MKRFMISNLFLLLILFLITGCMPQEAIYTQTNQINIVVTNIATSEIPEFLLMYPTNGQVLGTVHELKGRVSDDGAPSSVFVQTADGWTLIEAVTNYWRLVVTNVKLGSMTYQAYAIDNTGESSATDSVTVMISNVVPSVVLDWGGGFSTNTNILNLGVSASVGTSAFITNLKVVFRVNGMFTTNDLSFGGLADTVIASYPLTLTPNALNEVQVLAFCNADSTPGVSAISAVVVDQTAPKLVVSSPVDGATVGYLFDLNGNVSDDFGGGSVFVAWDSQTNEISDSSTWTCAIQAFAETNDFAVRVWAVDGVNNQSEIQTLHFSISNVPSLSCGLPDFYRTNRSLLNLSFQSFIGGGVLLTNVSVVWGTNVFTHTNAFSTNVSAFTVTDFVNLTENATNDILITVLADSGKKVSSSIKKILVDTQAPFFSVTNLFITNEDGSTNVRVSGVVYDLFHGDEQVQVWMSGDYRYRNVSIIDDHWWLDQKLSSAGVFTNFYLISDGLNVTKATNWIRLFGRPFVNNVSPVLRTELPVTNTLRFDFSGIITNTNEMSVTLIPATAFSKSWSSNGRSLIVYPDTEWEGQTSYQIILSNFVSDEGIEGRATNFAFTTVLAIPNASFEYGTFSSGDIISGTRTNWTAVSGSTVALVTNGVAESGSRCFWWKTLSTTARDEWSEKIAVFSGSNYTVGLSAFYPAANPLPAQVAFQIQYYHADGSANTNNSSDVSSYTILSVTNGWQSVTYDFTTPADTAWLQVRFKAKASSTTNSQIGIDSLMLKMK